MGNFARNTEVPVEKTRMEIERTLMRYGSAAFGYMYADNIAEVGFEANGRGGISSAHR